MSASPQRRKALSKYNNKPERVAHLARLYKYRKYGLTQEKYDALLTAQGGRCAICQQIPSQAEKRLRGDNEQLVVDHDHDTGVIRGLLCGFCNTGLGHFRDDPRRLRLAIAYLNNPAVNALNKAA